MSVNHSGIKCYEGILNKKMLKLKVLFDTKSNVSNLFFQLLRKKRNNSHLKCRSFAYEHFNEIFKVKPVNGILTLPSR